MIRRRISFLCHLCLVLVAICSVADAFFSNITSFLGSNSLWDELYAKCGNRASFNCVQGRLMDYVNDTLDSELRITDGIYFVKSARRHQQVNRVLDADSVPISHPHLNNTGTKIRTQRAVSSGSNSQSANEIQDPADIYEKHRVEDEIFGSFVRTVENIEDNLEAKPSSRRGKSIDSTSTESVPDASTAAPPLDHNANDSFVIRSLDKVTDLLYDKTTDYLSSHDLRLHLPEFMFGPSRMVISPRGVDSDGGILLKLNFDQIETPRGGISKLFKKMFKKKLLKAFIVILIIVKLIKIKLMYVLPVIVGVNAAKKILLKALLFLFPPLVHLFKLCTFYHAHASKLHFHHHKIKHHHHHIKVPVPVPVPVPSLKPHHHDHHDSYIGHEEYDAASPLLLDEHDHDHHGHHHHHSPYAPVADYGGHPEYYTRNDLTSQHGDELDSWGLKDFYANSDSPGVLSAQAQAYSPYAEQNYKVLAAAAAAATQKIPKGPTSATWKNKGGGSAGTKNTLLAAFDSFYSPILQKIDSIFAGLGFNEEGCRERLICSMYKDPLRFSPHSNLLSSELSRDPAELERPSQSNLAAVRFYKYVEAARVGQSQKDCLTLYPDCAVKTE